MLHKLSRWYNRIYAFLGGRFWKPCPICGEMFGGHECAPTGLMRGWYQGCGVCQGCDAEAQKRNEEWMEQNPFPAIEIIVDDMEIPAAYDVRQFPYGVVDEATMRYISYHTHADEAIKGLYTINGE